MLPVCGAWLAAYAWVGVRPYYERSADKRRFSYRRSLLRLLPLCARIPLGGGDAPGVPGTQDARLRAGSLWPIALRACWHLPGDHRSAETLSQRRCEVGPDR